MDYIPKSIKTQVLIRANYRCEYCQTSQRISGGQMHIEHVLPKAYGGKSTLGNLCLSCAWCNSFKWAKIVGIDPLTDQQVSLFDPRQQQWSEHFRWSDNGLYILGLTSIGRATVETLNMNNQFIVPARANWVEAGWHPPMVD